MNSNNPPPPPNPILSAYENFVRDTPLITRYVLTSQFVTCILSLFFDPSYAAANIPHFTILKLELYRIFISPLMCPSIFSLIFAYLSFNDNGRRLEFSMGSTHFVWLLMTIGLVTNISFIVISFVLYAISGNTLWLFGSSLGIWTILFGIIEIECIKAPPDSMRKLFFCTIPTIYYPLALCAIFSLLGGFQFPYLISIGVGYLYGHGYLDYFKISPARCKQWEDTILANFVTREGWVVSNEAMGSSSWNEDSAAGGLSVGGEGGPFNFFSRGGRPSQQPQQSDSSNTIPGAPRPGRVISNPSSGAAGTSSEAQSIPFGSGGRPLGSATRRSGQVDPRQARLEAIEKRSAAGSENV